MKNTVLSFKKAKEEGKKLSMLTAYDYSMAKIIDSCGINGILVGDSLGMVIKGDEDTLGVTVEDIICLLYTSLHTWTRGRKPRLPFKLWRCNKSNKKIHTSSTSKSITRLS